MKNKYITKANFIDFDKYKSVKDFFFSKFDNETKINFIITLIVEMLMEIIIDIAVSLILVLEFLLFA